MIDDCRADGLYLWWPGKQMGGAMKRAILGILAMAAVSLGSPPAAQAQQLVSASNPAALRAQFEAWGYRPGALQGADDQPLFEAMIGTVPTVVVLGGCQRGRSCNHVVLIATYSDVSNPPYEWLNRHNFDYNLVTAMRREDGLLTLRSGIMLGPQGVPASALRAAFDDWIAVNAEIARSATQAGLIRE